MQLILPSGKISPFISRKEHAVSAELNPDEDAYKGRKEDCDIPAKKGPGRDGFGLLDTSVLVHAALLWLLFIHICYNNEWMMGQISALTFLPLARRLYPGDREEQRQVLLRQGTYFNTHCECGAYILGMMADLEEKLALLKNPESKYVKNPAALALVEEIGIVRTSFMGVCGALGDTLFQKLLIPDLLLFCCGITLLCPMSSTGPLIYTMLMTILSFSIGMFSFFAGYKGGPEKLLRFLEGNFLRRVQKSLRILFILFAVPALYLCIGIT